MNITLQSNDIQKAISNYVSGMGIALTGKDLKVTFKVGRKGSGTTAAVSINDAGATTVANVAAAAGNGNPGDAAISITPNPTKKAPKQVDTTSDEAKQDPLAPAVEDVNVSAPEVLKERINEVKLENAEGQPAIVPAADGGVPETKADEVVPTTTSSLFA